MPVSLNYIFKRIILSILVILGVIVFSYLLLMLSPGDPAVKWAGNPRGPGATKAIELAREELGLNKPLYMQIVNFIYNFLTGNLGLSIAYKIPVSQVIVSGFAATLELMLFTYFFSVPLGIWLGIYSAINRGSRIDSFIQSMSIILASTPTFWLGSLLLLASNSLTGFFPYGRVSSKLALSTGFTPITGFYLLDSLIQGNIQVFIDVLVRLIPPALTISVYPIGVLARVTRTLVAEALLEDYVRAAVAWGIKRKTIIRQFVLRSIVPPVIQISGLSFVYSLVDAMVVETVVFGREGLGSILIDSLHKADFRVTLALAVYLTAFYIIVNTLVDIVQATIDPRIRL
ncbi:MAG: ABC transporter permease [Desulfurococcaceae archaeon]